MRPVIKWAGGKTQLLGEINRRLPSPFGTYYEPFLGGGALAIALCPPSAVLNDSNRALMQLYQTVQSSPAPLVDELRKQEQAHARDPGYYYHARALYNRLNKQENLDEGEKLMLSALFVYLNKAGFNGLYRLNHAGEMNVPSAKKGRVSLCDPDNIHELSRFLKRCTLLCGDFEDCCRTAKRGDFVFFDSPYYNTFDTYQAGGFSTDDHRRLSGLFHSLTERGVLCMLTNSNENFIKDLYAGFPIDVVSVKRNINRNGDGRIGEEIIVTNY